jgi:hypothetical protein
MHHARVRGGSRPSHGGSTPRSRGDCLAIARQNTDRPEDAEEALNEAFCLLLTRFDPGRFPEPMSWFTTTLKRLCWGIGRRGTPATSRPLWVKSSSAGRRGRGSLRTRSTWPARCGRRWDG